MEERRVFDNDSHEDDEKEPTDYTGLIIGAILVPVFVLVDYLSNDDVALAVFIVLGMIMLAVKMRWDSRKHVWFWATIVFIPTLFYTVPLGIVDFLGTLWGVDTAERFFSKDPSDEENGE